jgi:CheY-like chemotaxis protein
MDQTTAHERPLRALVLHHDGDALRAICRALEARDIEVLSAHDGTTGLALLLEELLALDVVVTAGDLPGRDARAFADLVRRYGGEQDLAMVVAAEDATASARRDLLAAGVDSVIERGEGSDVLADATVAAIALRRSSTSAPPPSAPATTAHAVAMPHPAAWTLALRLAPSLAA